MPLTQAADSALAALAESSGALAGLSATQLLMDRAHHTGARFQHRRTPSGRTRLLDACDGVLALALVRPTDWELLPAWLETEQTDWPASDSGWAQVAEAVAQREMPTSVVGGQAHVEAVIDIEPFRVVVERLGLEGDAAHIRHGIAEIAEFEGLFHGDRIVAQGPAGGGELVGKCGHRSLLADRWGAAYKSFRSFERPNRSRAHVRPQSPHHHVRRT